MSSVTSRLAFPWSESLSGHILGIHDGGILDAFKMRGVHFLAMPLLADLTLCAPEPLECSAEDMFISL